MLCTHCRRYEARPDDVTCTQCGTARSAVAVTPHGTARLRSPVGLGRAVAVLLGVVLATDLFALWTGFVGRGVWGDLAAGRGGADLMERAERADDLYTAAGVAQVNALVVTAVVFLVWFHRVRVTEVFQPFGHRMKRGWALGGWFVPVVNLWFPRRIAVDIWESGGPWDRPRSHGLLNAWWGAWLASLLAGRVASRTYAAAESAEEVRRALDQMLFADAVDAVAAVLAALFVLALTRMQDARARSGPPAEASVTG